MSSLKFLPENISDFFIFALLTFDLYVLMSVFLSLNVWFLLLTFTTFSFPLRFFSFCTLPHCLSYGIFLWLKSVCLLAFYVLTIKIHTRHKCVFNSYIYKQTNTQMKYFANKNIEYKTTTTSTNSNYILWIERKKKINSFF